MKVGCTVKSYDFNGNDSCYMIGVVTELLEEQGLFRAQMTKRVWRGKEDAPVVGGVKVFQAPLQGQLMLDDPSEPRVVVLS